MIRINTIHIEEFRGIRNLTLQLNGNNFGICGPNGTGKSGVVDAIEFCITGDVTRLSGQGTSDLSVKAHAPHVDQHDHPEISNVTITADIPSLGKSVKIHRSVKNPRKVNITPNDTEIRNIIEELRIHPEFALSRREIIKYIITPPGKRSEDVQTLLRLDHLEKLRKNLTTFCNKFKKNAEEARHAFQRAEIELKAVLKIDKLDSAIILEKVNVYRKILGLEVLTGLTERTSLKTGVLSPSDKKKQPVLIKAVALAEIKELQAAIKEQEPSELTENRQSAQEILVKLLENEKILALALSYNFIATGLGLIAEDACPLCDKEWDADTLREYLRRKLDDAEEITQLLSKVKGNISTVHQSLNERIPAIEKIILYCKNLNPPVETVELIGYLDQLKKVETSLSQFKEDYKIIEQALQVISESWWSPKTEQQLRIDECQAAITALPDISAEDEAREILIISQERFEKLLDAKKMAKKLSDKSAIANKVMEHYNNSATGVLESIYDQVAEDFTNYYRAINRDDEEKFQGKLISVPAKLGFNVDFYGRGLFPPGAYHSEGHQDGMGLCLYLALMKQTLSEKFTFAVLDDVLMSVDTGHRRDVCRLLKSEFPDTQFILTTHDRVWLQYMKTEKLIERSQSFAGWTVDTGPRVWNDQDIWSEIQAELDKNNVPGAATLLRRYLEYTATILADKLRAQVEFKGDGRYDLGDLFPRVLKEWRKRLEDGEKASESWGDKDKKEAISRRRAQAKELIGKTRAEDWAINPTVHFNDWANLESHEFQIVVDAFKELLKALRCRKEECKSYLYISPHKGNAEELRCNCGDTVINLKKKI